MTVQALYISILMTPKDISFAHPRWSNLSSVTSPTSSPDKGEAGENNQKPFIYLLNLTFHVVSIHPKLNRVVLFSKNSHVTFLVYIKVLSFLT